MEKTGIKRNLHAKAANLLDKFPVLTILGARQTGKTTLSRQLRPDWKYFDLENPETFDLISRDPVFFFSRYPESLILDEAQEYPALFKVLRGVIDAQRSKKGRFIITGSSSPELLTHLSESLAGRIAILELGTLKANEFFETRLSDVYNIFNQKITAKNTEAVVQALSKAPPNLSLSQMQTLWLKGGYPEPLLNSDDSFYPAWMDNYRDTYINRDIAKLFPKLNKISYRRFLSILSKLSGTILNKRDLARTLEISEGSVSEYLKIAEGTFLWRALPSFEKNVIKSIIKMPKGHLRDTGLLHHNLKINTLESLYTDPIVGKSFESFVIEEVLKGLEATMTSNWQCYYYRTKNGAEIDLVLDGPFGVLPIEIKSGSAVSHKQMISLKAFIEEHKLPLGIIINQANTIEWLSPSIVQIPINWF